MLFLFLKDIKNVSGIRNDRKKIFSLVIKIDIDKINYLMQYCINTKRQQYCKLRNF